MSRKNSAALLIYGAAALGVPFATAPRRAAGTLLAGKSSASRRPRRGAKRRPNRGAVEPRDSRWRAAAGVLLLLQCTTSVNAQRLLWLKV